MMNLKIASLLASVFTGVQAILSLVNFARMFFREDAFQYMEPMTILSWVFGFLSSFALAWFFFVLYVKQRKTVAPAASA